MDERTWEDQQDSLDYRQWKAEQDCERANGGELAALRTEKNGLHANLIEALKENERLIQRNESLDTMRHDLEADNERLRVELSLRGKPIPPYDIIMAIRRLCDIAEEFSDLPQGSGYSDAEAVREWIDTIA